MSEFQMPILTPIQSKIFNELALGEPLSRKDLDIRYSTYNNL